VGLDVEVPLKATLADVQRWIPLGSVILEEVPEGVILRGQLDELERLAAQLVMLDCPLVVRTSPELRAALRAVAERALAIAAR
jgi:hypothetical protein